VETRRVDGATWSAAAAGAGLAAGGLASAATTGASFGGESVGSGTGSLAVRSGTEGIPTDLLSDNAMALPMSTLTSGRRRTYPNRSAFQAHVCCIMDPMQVPKVLELLQGSPQFKSVRCWPHAYRVISPFDGQTHEGSEDDGDPGAGEKMLGLLTRMGLENLFLIMSHWDTGPVNRHGAELFRCVNEQCKVLLVELQQAVRASFPPEELLGHSQSDPMDEIDAAQSLNDLEDGFFGNDDLDLIFSTSHNDNSPGATLATANANVAHGASRQRATPWQQTLRPSAQLAAKVMDLDSIGMRPPSELLWTARGHAPSAASGRVPQLTLARLEHMATKGSGNGLEPTAMACSLAERSAKGSARLRMAGTQLAANSSSTGSRIPSERQLCTVGSASRPTSGGGQERMSMSRMTSEQLLRLAEQLRADRGSLEHRLGDLGRTADVICALNVPIFDTEVPDSDPKDHARQTGNRQVGTGNSKMPRAAGRNVVSRQPHAHARAPKSVGTVRSLV